MKKKTRFQISAKVEIRLNLKLHSVPRIAIRVARICALPGLVGQLGAGTDPANEGAIKKFEKGYPELKSI